VAFSEIERKRIDATVGALCRRLNSPGFTDELRFVYEVEGHAVSIFEERAPWDGVGGWTRMGIARFRFFRTRGEWQLYWMRRDLCWHEYEPALATREVARLVAVVEADEHGAFFG
jgi:hypothetical protein